MKPEVAAALEASIEHWKENARAERCVDAHISCDDCPLCALFFDDENLVCESADLGACLIKMQTGVDVCENSPWVDCANTLTDWFDHPEDTSLRDAFHAVALKMIAFLESLREPEGGAHG